MIDFINKKTGALIVPTGIGASIGGYAGDASCVARKFSEKFNLIVNPNVVNAGCFSGINENMLYVEGYSLDEFFKGNLNLTPVSNNKIGVVFDKAISNEVLNVHINTINAVKTVYGIDVAEWIITDEEVGVDFSVDRSGISTGSVKNIETIFRSCEKLLENGCEAIALVCLFDDEDSEDYSSGCGVDPVGGVEAILSHSVSKKFEIPTAHSPAFEDYQIYPQIVNAKAAAEYITPTFLPCILQGLAKAPKLSNASCFNINDLKFLIMPYNAIGSTPVYECLKRNIPIFAISENKTVLNVTNDLIFRNSGIIQIDTYEKCLELLS